jgi:hypothetical protein
MQEQPMHRNSESMERLLTLIMTGGYGTVMVWMFIANKLGWTRGERTLIMLVTPWIQFMVFLGGALLLILFFVLLFNFRRAARAHHEHGENGENGSEATVQDDTCCEHDHEHQEGHDHAHGEGCCDHDHSHAHSHDQGSHDHGPEECCDHGHEHGWNPARYIPLLIPLILYMMGLPSDQMIRSFERHLTEKALKGMASYNAKAEEFAPVANWLLFTPYSGELATSLGSALQLAAEEIDDDSTNVKPVVTDLAQVERVLMDPNLMAEFQRYRKVELEGMFSLESTGPMTIFRVVRLRMACCLNDSRPSTILCATRKKIDARLIEKPTGSETKWCKVQGKLKFAPGADGKYQAFLKASSVVPATMPPFPYLN